MWISNKVFKDIKIFCAVHSRSFIRYQGKNLNGFWIWCCFQFFLHCLVQPNQDIRFLLHVIFIKNQTLKYSNSQLVLFMLLKYCSLNAKRWNANWLELFPWCLKFSEFIVSIFNRLKFILIINTFNLSLTKIYLYTDNKNHQYCTTFTFSPLKNITKHLFIM